MGDIERVGKSRQRVFSPEPSTGASPCRDCKESWQVEGQQASRVSGVLMSRQELVLHAFKECTIYRRHKHASRELRLQKSFLQGFLQKVTPRASKALNVASQGLRHSPISPPHEGREMVKAASTISPQLGLDRTPLPHSPMSPAPEKAGYLDQKPVGSPFSAIAAQQQQHWSHKEQARPTHAGHTATDKAAQGAGGKNAGPALHGKDGLAPISDASGRQAAQEVQELVTAISPATLQQALATEPGNVSQGSQHAKAASPETDASRQAAGQVAKRAEERLRELLMDSDYNEKNWCYVDPQVSRINARFGFEAIHEMRMAADPIVLH